MMRLRDASNWHRLALLPSKLEGRMYARTKRVKHGQKTYEYLQVVESRRVNGQPRQRLVDTLGRLEGKDPGQALRIADALIRFFAKRTGQATEGDSGGIGAGQGRHFADIVAIEEAWRSLGLDKILERLGEDRKFDFSLERAVFTMVAQRLIAPSSKLACVDWLLNDVYLPSAGALDEDDLYATLTWLEEVAGDAELKLFEKLRRDGKIDVNEKTAFFYDTTGIHFEGNGPAELAAYGRPKAGQPRDRPIALVGLVRSREGWPITHKVFPGNRADVSTVIEIIDDLKRRFEITRFIFVGDRGMVSKEVIAHLVKHGLQFVLAMKMRSVKEVREKVLGRAGRFKVVSDNLEVKEVLVEDRRYIVCRNPASIERDRRRREHILGELRKALEGGVRANSQRGAELRANRAYRRYLRVKKGKLVISARRVAEDERTDGRWVIYSNVDEAEAAELARAYKDLGRIEPDFRDLKSFIELRPVYHRKEPRVRAHAFVCVLAKVVMNELERRLFAHGPMPFTIERALKLLGRITVTPLRAGTTRLWVRTDLDDEARRVVEALGIPARRLPQSMAYDDPPLASSAKPAPV